MRLLISIAAFAVAATIGGSAQRAVELVAVVIDSDSPVADAQAVAGPLSRAADYVARFERTFAAVIWHEHYVQEDHALVRFPASGNRVSRLVGQRELQSELLLMWLPLDTSWIAVRDVVSVDGVPRPLTTRGLRTVLDASSVSVDRLKELAAENGRFNIGEIVRTFNEPTLALLFLDEHYRHRFAFKRTRQDSLGGRVIVRYDFVERTRPTVIRDQAQDVPAHGTMLVDDSSGDVLQTALELSNPQTGIHGTMTVRYEPHATFDVLVPVEMREEYSSLAGEHITAVATYSDFRRFETSGRLIAPK